MKGNMSTDGQIHDRDAALAFLYGRIDYERSAKLPYRSRGLKLDRMRELLSHLGNPHQQFPVIHVAGTKGKGSTSAMVAAILSAAGYRTGLYTSPHLNQIEERMAVGGKPCSGEELIDLVEQVRAVVEQMDAECGRNGKGERGPTYFEITTAAAMLHFARRGVDATVLEVGLGGRLDSTNVCTPEVCVITSISLDHTRQLGNSLALIAAEKAGIIKPGIPVVTGVTDAEPLGVIERIAGERGSACYVSGRDFHFQYHGSQTPLTLDAVPSVPLTGWNRFDYWETGDAATRLERVTTGLLGRHQASNGAVALATVGRLRERGWKVDESHIREGLATVRVAARTEVILGSPLVMIDAAHNVASIEALLDLLREAAFSTRTTRRILVFSTSEDKDAAGMLRRLLPEFDLAILTRYMNNPRFVSPADLRALAEETLRDVPARRTQLSVQPDPASAWAEAEAAATATDLICVTGSFFLASEVRELIVTRTDRPSL